MLEHGPLETPIDRQILQRPFGVSFHPPGEIEVRGSEDQDLIFDRSGELAVFYQI